MWHCVILVVLVTSLSYPVSAAPQLKPKPSDAPSLAGTIWVGKSLEGVDQTISFAAEGRMTIVKGERTIDKCSWTQDGAKVAWEVNDRYAEYAGTMNGDTIEVTAHNKAGKTWTATLTRKREK